MSKKASQKFVPGEYVSFDYTDNKGVKTFDREVLVERVEDKNGDTLVGGNDLSLGEDEENYRNFYVSQMSNARVIDNSLDPDHGKKEVKSGPTKLDLPTEKNMLLFELTAIEAFVRSVPENNVMMSFSKVCVLDVINNMKTAINSL